MTIRRTGSQDQPTRNQKASPQRRGERGEGTKNPLQKAKDFRVSSDRIHRSSFYHQDATTNCHLSFFIGHLSFICQISLRALRVSAVRFFLLRLGCSVILRVLRVSVVKRDGLTSSVRMLVLRHGPYYPARWSDKCNTG